MSDKYLIWWTNQNDCERIVPLDTWPKYLYDEFQSRYGRWIFRRDAINSVQYRTVPND
jgi:hypothetical protein